MLKLGFLAYSFRNFRLSHAVIAAHSLVAGKDETWTSLGMCSNPKASAYTSSVFRLLIRYIIQGAQRSRYLASPVFTSQGLY